MGGTNVTGLTIQEIFITGRKPTFTVALTCSKFFAPAIHNYEYVTKTEEEWGGVPITAMEAR